jgi:hypothetical protein
MQEAREQLLLKFSESFSQNQALFAEDPGMITVGGYDAVNPYSIFTAAKRKPRTQEMMTRRKITVMRKHSNNDSTTARSRGTTQLNVPDSLRSETGGLQIKNEQLQVKRQLFDKIKRILLTEKRFN